MELVYENKIPNNKEAFKEKVKEVASALGINANSLMMVMAHESGLKPWAQNTAFPFKDGLATGLIQFIPSTARHLGTSEQALKSMSNVDQMYYVYKYYEPYKKFLKSDSLLDEYTKLYLITFYPNAGGTLGGTLEKPDTWEFPDVVYRNNPIFDHNKDGKLTIKDFKEFNYHRVPDDWKKKFKKKTGLFSGRNIAIGLTVVVVIIAIAAAVRNQQKKKK